VAADGRVVSPTSTPIASPVLVWPVGLASAAKSATVG
jgi:hypothetical protein